MWRILFFIVFLLLALTVYSKVSSSEYYKFDYKKMSKVTKFGKIVEQKLKQKYPASFSVLNINGY